MVYAVSGKLLAITDLSFASSADSTMFSVFLARSGKHLSSGARHDVYTYRFHRLERFLGEFTLADKGYIRLGLLTPVKRKAGVRLRAAVRQNNRQINRLRSVVERTIAQVKTWRVLHSGFRRLWGSYGRVFSLVRGLVFYAAGGPPYE